MDRTPDMACGIDGRWGYAAWCWKHHTWIDDEPYPGSTPCPWCGGARARLHITVTLGTKDGHRRRKADWEGVHGWEPSEQYGWVYRSWSLNRTCDIYEEIVATLDGMVIYEVAEPLSLHVGRGSARLGGQPPGYRPRALRRLTPEERSGAMHFRILPLGLRGWDAIAPNAKTDGPKPSVAEPSGPAERAS
jgi:hypothetical protein